MVLQYMVIHENIVYLYARHKEESSSSDEDLRAAKQGSSATQSDPLVGSGGVSYKKTLRLTSEQLVRSYLSIIWQLYVHIFV